MVDLPPDDIEELLGYVAAAANHSEQPVIRRSYLLFIIGENVRRGYFHFLFAREFATGTRSPSR